MKLLYDLTATQPDTNGSKFHGGGEYAKILFQELIKKREDENIHGVYNKKKLLDPNINKLCSNNNIKLISIEKNEELGQLVNDLNYDVFYSALPYKYADFNFKKTNFIYTIHGLRPIEMPTDIYELKYIQGFLNLLKFTYKNLFRKKYINKKESDLKPLLKKKNQKIIVVSNHTKYTILNHFPFVDAEQIEVLYPPRKKYILENDKDRKNQILNNYAIEDNNYFFIISSNRWRKNSYRAIRALDNLFDENPQINKKVVVLGYKGKVDFNIKNKNRFRFEGYVEREVLEVLYKFAFAFIYPTLNEGFGYPPLEAMKYGTPCLVSAISSVPEVCDDSVLYFNPYSINEIKTRLLNLCMDSSLYCDLTKKSRERHSIVSKKQDKMLDYLINLIFEKSR